MEVNVHERAVRAAKTYVTRKGYEVIGESWSKESLAGRIDVIAKDDDAIVFIEVTTSTPEAGGFSQKHLSREQFEILAAMWFAENPEQSDIRVRFDTIAMMVFSENKALLRHHIDSLGAFAGSDD